MDRHPDMKKALGGDFAEAVIDSTVGAIPSSRGYFSHSILRRPRDLMFRYSDWSGKRVVPDQTVRAVRSDIAHAFSCDLQSMTR